MLENKIDQIVDVDNLPTLPAIAVEAIRLMEGKSSCFKSVADLLKNDQVLTGKILHYANSAYVGSRRKVSSISQALSILGFNAVRSIILSVSIFDCFSGKSGEHKERLLDFWLHSIGVAAMAEILAKRLNFPVPDEAYIAGLMHDLGKLVCYIQSPEKFKKICQELDSQGSYSTHGDIPLDIEKKILGTTHVEIGKLIAERWKLPEVYAKVMWLHHQPVFETITPDEANLPLLIRFADVLCTTHNIGASYFLTTGSYCHEHYHFVLENIVLRHHLSTEDIEEILKQVYEKVRDMGSILGICDEDVYRRQISSANVSLGSMSMSLEMNNRDLMDTNQSLNAMCEMTRKLHLDLSLHQAAGVILNAARKAFNINRCLCIIRDNETRSFVGRFFDGIKFHEIMVPAHIEKIKLFHESRSNSEIESEAVRCLERTMIESSEGSGLESGIINMVAGSSFLAAFFMADKHSHWKKEPILGELMIDFSDNENFRNNGLRNISTNFEALALAASSGVERIILKKYLTGQAHKMAESSRKMEESQRQLFHSHRLATVGRLAAGAAHEINNPLTIISLNIQLLKRFIQQSDVDPVVLERLGVISDQEQRISKIIQELMGFARPAQPKFCESSLSKIMEKVLSVIGDRVSMDKITIDSRIAEDIPPLMVDPLQIEQVLMNLIINACQAMSGGGKITFSAKTGKKFVEVAVSDTGSGIATKNLGKVFDPFFTTKKEGEGTGLGLSICHSIVAHNGGSLRVRSELGAGTTFIVALPIDNSVRLRQMKKALEQKEAVSAVPELEKCRILIIDDEHLLNNMLQDSVRSAGYEVDGAYDGIEGINLLRFKKYDLILLDMRMPRMDGMEVLKFVRSEYPEVQVIIVTGLASLEEIQKTVEKGAFACIKKPFHLEEILATISRALQGKCSPSK
ncbi:MAG: HDOD domain-containing protein [Thermodesulfobacteriota bacterium]|nr:HDOD domain-containing protein [Thermodesulfobacteriota bacterium]